MAIKNLKRFMTERLLDLDPNLSESEGSLMFTKVINPLLARLSSDPTSMDIETFIISRIKDEFPQLDINTPGSILRDVLVSPLIMILEPLRREIYFLKLQQSLGNVSSLSELEMDALLSNVLTVRNYGSTARGTVRVFFNAPRSFGLDSSIVFSTSDGINFVSDYPKTIFKENFIRSGKHWYVDLPVVSKEPDVTANVEKNKIKFVNGLDGVVRVTNLYAFSGGVTKETNEDFLVRAERSLTERSLNTTRGIETELYNQFTDLVSLRVIGYGEKEMQRDILTGDPMLDLSEAVGDLVYMTTDWATVPLAAEGLGSSGSSLVFPFTNTFLMKEPAGGWDPDMKVSIKNAKYVRIADGNQYYTNKLLGRVRVVDTVEEHINGDLYVRVSDFEIYPKPSSIFTFNSVNPMPVDTSSAKHGLNAHSKQGSDFKLFGSKDGVEYVTGAHLPFTDHITTSFNVLDVPASVIPGRDFLVLGSQDGPETSDHLHPYKLEVYPLLDHYGAEDLGIARKDSFLTSKDRVLYKGEDNFAYDPTLEYSGMREYTHIYEFGGPKLSVLTDEGDVVAYSGTDFESFGRRPGAALEGKLVNTTGAGSSPDPDDVVAADAAAYECDIVLHYNQPTWANMNIETGHYISCTAYPARYAKAGDANTVLEYNGELADVPDLLQWQAWGRVKAVGYGDPWRLRVEGMDWTNLQEYHINSFSPQAEAQVTIEKSFDVWEATGSTGSDIWGLGAYVNLRAVSSSLGVTTETLPETPLLLDLLSPMAGEGQRGLTEQSESGMSLNLTGVVDMLSAIDLGGGVGVIPAGEKLQLGIIVRDHRGRDYGYTDPTDDSSGIHVLGEIAFSADTDITDDADVLAATALASGEEVIIDLLNEAKNSLESVGTNAVWPGEHIVTMEFDSTDPAALLPVGSGLTSINYWLRSIFYASFKAEALGTGEHTFMDIIIQSTGGASIQLSTNPVSELESQPLINARNPSPRAMCDHIIGLINSDPSVSLALEAELIRPAPDTSDTDYVDLPCSFAVKSLQLGGKGNGGHVWLTQTDGATSPVDEADSSYVTLSIWNGSYVSSTLTDLYGNINGGFSGGFGPRLQVVGLEDVDPTAASVFDTNTVNPDSVDNVTLPDPYLPFLDDAAVYGDSTPYELSLTMVASDKTAGDGQVDAETGTLSFNLLNTPVAYPLLSTERSMVRIIMDLILPNRDSNHTDGGLPVPQRVRIFFEDDGDGGISQTTHWADALAAAGGGSEIYDFTDCFLDPDGTNEINYATGQVKLTFKNTGADGTDPGIVLAGWDITDPASPVDYEIGDLEPSYTGEHEGSTIKFYSAYTYVFSPFKLFWTVYRGMTEMLSPNGVVLPSWDEFQFLPAAKNPSIDFGTNYAPIHAPTTSQYFGDMQALSIGGGTNSGVWEGLVTDFGDTTYAYSNRAIGTLTPFVKNDMKALWIRLNKPFNLEHPSLSATPSEACLSASVSHLEGVVGDGDQTLRRTNYTAKRYQYEKSEDITPSQSGETSLIQPLSLPLVGGSTRLSDVDQDSPSVSLSSTSLANMQGYSGFLIPHPMGKDYDTHFATPAASPDWTDPSEDILENQVVQLYNAHPTTGEDALISVSGIPGSTPFPGWFGPGLLVANNEVHIGGMTDVYVKPSTSTDATTPPLLMQPEDPSAAYADGGQILVAASDGVVNPSLQMSHFYSAELEAALADAFGSAPRPLNNLVLEILDPPSSELQPTHFRIINSVAGGVVIDGSFPESLGLGFEELRFRVMRECSTNLAEPLIVLKKGDDLILTENSRSAYSPSGYDFLATPSDAEMYLYIDSEKNRGEYRIEAINLNNLILEKAIEESVTGASYRIYTKQDVGVSYPLVRVKEVSLSDDKNYGVMVPYRHPVDVVSSDFSGLNDDAMTQATFGIDGGQLSVESVDLNLDGQIDTDPETETELVQRACFTLDNTVNLAEYGVALYDVLRLDALDEDQRYWYVEGVTDGYWPVDTYTDASIELAVPGNPANGQAVISSNTRITTSDDVDWTTHIGENDLVVLGSTGSSTPSPEVGKFLVSSVSYSAGAGTTIDIDITTHPEFTDGFLDVWPGGTYQVYFQALGKNNKLVLNKTIELPKATDALEFTLGHPSVGTGTVYFRDKTYFLAGPDTVFSYRDPLTEKKSYLRPSPAERAQVYTSEPTSTDLIISNSLLADPDDTTRVIQSEAINFFKHGILPGDKLQISSKVIWSDTFRGDSDPSGVAYEEHESLMVGGKTLAVLVDSSMRTCTFSGPNPMTLDDVVADINRQLGDVLYSDVYEFDAEGTPGQYVIRIFSSKDIQLVTQGSIGILEQEGLRFITQRDNTPDPKLIREYTVSKLDYIEPTTDAFGDPVSAKYRLWLTQESSYGDFGDGKLREYMQAEVTGGAWGSVGGGPGIKDFEEVFISVYREKYQGVFPSELSLDSSGLYKATIKLTSYDPNIAGGIVPDNSQMTVEGYDSLGYDIVVSNENYSYSMGEDSSIRVTPVVLDSSSKSFETVYEVAGSSVVINYDRAQLVQDVQHYLLNKFVRVVCNNPLARHFLPAYPMMSISTSGGKLSNEDLKAHVIEYLSSLYPNKPLELFDLSSVLTKRGVTYAKFPQEAAFLLHGPDRRISVARNKDVVYLGNQYHIMEDTTLVKVNGS